MHQQATSRSIIMDTTLAVMRIVMMGGNGD